MVAIQPTIGYSKPGNYYMDQGCTRLFSGPNTYLEKFIVKSFEAFTLLTYQFDDFWVVTPCSVVLGCHRFRYPCCLHLHPEDGGSMDL
jgi:hypothetical protein